MPTFSRVAPSIYVSDLKRAIQFYTDAMGFSFDSIDDPPLRAVMYFERWAVLHLDLESVKAGSSKTHMIVDGLATVFDRLTKGNAKVIQPPTDQPWGLREAIVADPDGNVFELGEPIRKPVSTNQ